jgi:prephenate dehydratase
MSEEKKIACLGPRGSHSEAAARRLFAKEDILLYPTISAAIESLRACEADVCVAPIENSIEGSINITMDKLALEGDFCIVRELVWPIRHHLASQDEKTPLTTVMSHPQALAQCRETLKKLLPAAVPAETGSTSEAAERAAADKSAGAVSSIEAARIYGLRVRAYDIQDTAVNCTRFVVLRPAAFTGAQENAGKTSLACELEGDKPGVLYELLKSFALRGINLVRIESRPARTALGRYIFFLDLEGSVDDKAISDALTEVRENTLWLKILGSYPVLKV